MANYYIETVNGRRGPYTAEDIARGVRKGTVPLGARLVDQQGQPTTPAEVIRSNHPRSAPVDSGPAPDAPRPADSHPVAKPQQPAYPQQPSYPQAPAYPQQSSYPYPGNAGQYAPQPQVYHPYGQPMPYPVQYTPATSGLAIASLTLSLTTLVLCLPLWIGGLICGYMALGECQPNGPKSGRGLALAGLWTGAIFGVLYVLGVILFVAMVNADVQTW
jgi:hypothetical protein